jgi:hypothetical protein
MGFSNLSLRFRIRNNFKQAERERGVKSMTDELQKALDIMAKSDAPTGAVVSNADGTEHFFLTDDDMRRTAVKSEHHQMLNQLQQRPIGGPIAGGPIATPATNCVKVKKWLDTHDPNTDEWRQIVVIWGYQCA